jgi:uncharacterized protein YegP (UPF0339 family)
MSQHVPKARRVVVYEARDGWRFKVQAGNWRTIDASEEGKRSKAAVLRKVQKYWPDVEMVER